jgi:hypothetical protein
VNNGGSWASREGTADGFCSSDHRRHDKATPLKIAIVNINNVHRRLPNLVR